MLRIHQKHYKKMILYIKTSSEATYGSLAHQSHPHSHCPRHRPMNGGYTCHCHSENPMGSKWATLKYKKKRSNPSRFQKTVNQLLHITKSRIFAVQDICSRQCCSTQEYPHLLPKGAALIIK